MRDWTIRYPLEWPYHIDYPVHKVLLEKASLYLQFYISFVAIAVLHSYVRF